MSESYLEYPLDNDYRCTAEQMDDITLAIVGKDPYPMGACAIPFIKATWPEMDGRSAGYHLFESLLGRSFMSSYKSPREAAFALLKRGVVLLNVSSFLTRQCSQKTGSLGTRSKNGIGGGGAGV